MKRFGGWWIGFVLSCLVSVNFASAQDHTDETSGQKVDNYVNERGDESLVFLAAGTAGKVPYSHTQLHLDTRSLFDGWVAIEQCRDYLDAVPDAKAAYDFQAVRDLRVIEARDIEKAWVDGQSVLMKNVGKGARLCVGMQAMLMQKVDAGVYRMEYGPLQRRLLDSYFPMHVSLDLDTSNLPLQLDSITPDPALGYSVQRRPDGVGIEAWFRGKLTFEMQFRLPGHER